MFLLAPSKGTYARDAGTWQRRPTDTSERSLPDRHTVTQGGPMTDRRLRSMYVFGIGLNTIAMVYAALDGAYLFALTFAFVMVYLGVRLWMVTTQ